MGMRRAVDQSYLLRVWADRVGNPLRATLTAVGEQHVRRQFATLEELVAFLIAAAQRQQSAERSDDGDDDDTRTP